jgi:dipeptidase E
MKLLLTSGGISNASIRNALVELLGKPIAECKALIIPTAIYAFAGGAGSAWRIISGNAATPLAELGWKELGVLELTALPSIPEEYWVAEIQTADALLVSGGDPPFLSYWMQESGLASRIPSLKAVYVGVSAGSLVMGPRVGEEFIYWKPPSGDDRTLAIVDFSMFPHLDHPAMPDHSMTKAEEWAAKMSVPAYALDDQTAIKVNEASIEVISEGRWKLFTPSRGA